MNRLANVKKIRQFVYLVLALSVLLETQHTVAGNTFFIMTKQISMPIDPPLVVLQNVTANTVIYTNSTSAKVAISSGTTNSDVLEILNQTTDDWQLQLINSNSTDIARLTNCTIWFRNGSTTSIQIEIINGSYNQTSGALYDFVLGSNNYISITASANATGTSLIYTYLKILKPSTSTYMLYIITFEIT
ncbi:MAG: hypothetical protein QXN36_05430 [Candidatus Bathyarchaeia archaeon]